MATSVHVFDRLQDDLGHHLRSPSTRPRAVAWGQAEPALAGCQTALDAAERCRDRAAPGGGRPALAALVRLAGMDELAVDAALWGVLLALRSVAARLTASWRAEREVIDQAVATAGWSRLMAVAGSDLVWPDRTIAEGARVAVRDGLRSEARDHTRLRSVDPVTLGGLSGSAHDSEEAAVDAADLLGSAVRHRVVSPQAARLVWAVRMTGESPAAAGAAAGISAKAATMTCLRAERALRAQLLAEAS